MAELFKPENSKPELCECGAHAWVRVFDRNLCPTCWEQAKAEAEPVPIEPPEEEAKEHHA